MVCPTARVIRTIVSKSSSPSRSIAATRVSASASALLNADAPSACGKPSARQSRCAWPGVSPAAAATSSPVSSGYGAENRPLEVLRIRHQPCGLRGRARRSPSAGPARPAECRCSSTRPELARVGDHEGAAAEDPVDQALLVGDVADPVHRDVVAAPGEDARAGDQAAVGEGVRRQQPVAGTASRTNHSRIAMATITQMTHRQVPAWSPRGQAGQVARQGRHHDQHHRGQDQRLHVRARAEHDVLALVEELRGDRHAAIMPRRRPLSGVRDSLGTHVDDVPGAQVLLPAPPCVRRAGRPRRRRPPRRPPRRRARPPDLLAGRGAQLEVRRPQVRARAATRRSAPRAPPPGAASSAERSTGPPVTIASEVASGTGSSSSVWSQLIPMPTTAAADPSCSIALEQDPAELVVVGEHVVGPLQGDLDPRDAAYGGSGGDPGQQRQPRPPLRRARPRAPAGTTPSASSAPA